jgi:hypothetical protein
MRTPASVSGQDNGPFRDQELRSHQPHSTVKTNTKNNPKQSVCVPPLLRMTAMATAILPLILPGTISGQSDDFSDGNDVGWFRLQPLAPFGAPGSYTFPSGHYRIQAAASTNFSSLGPGRAGSVRTDVTNSQFLIAYDVVAWNGSLDQSFGAGARLKNTGFDSTTGYGLVYHTSAHEIAILRIDNEFPTILASSFVVLNPVLPYRFVFSGQGSSLNGQVFDVANLSTPLATVSTTEGTYASGVNALFVFDSSFDGTSTADATFDNYSAALFAATQGTGWFTLDGGGGTSTGAVFAVRGTIGQLDAGKLTNGATVLNGGLWGGLAVVQSPGAPRLTITHTPTNTALVLWPSPSTGFTLQENTNGVASVNWSNVSVTPSDNGTDKFIIVNPPVGNRFYRLFKP